MNSAAELSIKSLKKLHTVLIKYQSRVEEEDFINDTYQIEKILKGDPQLDLVGRNIQTYCDIQKSISWGESYNPNGEKYYYQIQMDTKYVHPYLEVYCIAIKYPNGNLYRGYLPDPNKNYSFIR